MKVEIAKKVNKDKSVTTTISFEQLLPRNLLNALEENGITDTRNDITLAVDSNLIKRGVAYGTISSTIYP